MYQQRLHPACPVLVELHVGIEAQQSSSRVLKSQELAGEIDLDENKALNPLPALPFPLMCLWSSDQTGQPCSGGAFQCFPSNPFKRSFSFAPNPCFLQKQCPDRSLGLTVAPHDQLFPWCSFAKLISWLWKRLATRGATRKHQYIYLISLINQINLSVAFENSSCVGYDAVFASRFCSAGSRLLISRLLICRLLISVL